MADRTLFDQGPRWQGADVRAEQPAAIAAPGSGPKEAGPCGWCHRFKWWRSTWGVIVCGNCHPPLDPEAVEWIDPPAGLPSRAAIISREMSKPERRLRWPFRLG